MKETWHKVLIDPAYLIEGGIKKDAYRAFLLGDEIKRGDGLEELVNLGILKEAEVDGKEVYVINETTKVGRAYMDLIKALRRLRSIAVENYEKL